MDIVISIILIILFSPLLIVISFIILADSRGRVIYLQKRVGRFNRDFYIYKFRTMKPGADRKGLLTVGGQDSRITRAGVWLRKYKLDELPQLFNVLAGDMSLVGPRPEVRKYVDLYTPEQQRVLCIKPGITDYASVLYADENELLGKASDPEKEYIQTIMQAKLKLNLKYLEESGLQTDMKILLDTVRRILFHR